jgi:hypothetical protein
MFLMTEESQILGNLYCLDLKIEFEDNFVKCEILSCQQLRSNSRVESHTYIIYCVVYVSFYFLFNFFL